MRDRTANGTQRVKVTDINSVGPYTILETDYILGVRYTSTGVITLTLPLVSDAGDGKVYVIMDNGYNAATYNITVARSGSDKINNVAGNYTISANGNTVSLRANANTNNWEIC